MGGELLALLSLCTIRRPLGLGWRLHKCWIIPCNTHPLADLSAWNHRMIKLQVETWYIIRKQPLQLSYGTRKLDREHRIGDGNGWKQEKSCGRNKIYASSCQKTLHENYEDCQFNQQIINKHCVI